MIKIWISPKQRGEVRTEFKIKLSSAQIDEISEKLLSMNDWIPREFARNELLFQSKIVMKNEKRGKNILKTIFHY